jgi:hypothetical protein
MRTACYLRKLCRRRTPCVGLARGACGLLLPAVLCLLTLSGCWSSEPFAYVKVHGKVSYEDGSLIPVDPLLLDFYPLDNTPKGKDYPRPGSAVVDKASGKFDSVSSHRSGDGLAVGKYKVTLRTMGPVPMLPSVMPPEYGYMNRTPLEVDTANSPFELKVRKPL